MMEHDASRRGRTNTRRGLASGASGLRFAWGMLFATCMAVCVVPMGCGSTDEYAVVPEHRAQALPGSTIDALQACAGEGAGRLQHHAYEIRFEVELDDDGAVRGVKPTGWRLDDDRLEGCMIDALRALPEAGFAPESMSGPSLSRALPGNARNAMGSVTVLPELVELIPVVVTGSGVTIVVVVAVVVVVAAVAMAGKMSEECKEEWDTAYEQCDKEMEDPDARARTGGYKNRKACARGKVRVGCGGNAVDRGNQDKGAQPGRRT